MQDNVDKSRNTSKQGICYLGRMFIKCQGGKS